MNKNHVFVIFNEKLYLSRKPLKGAVYFATINKDSINKEFLARATDTLIEAYTFAYDSQYNIDDKEIFVDEFPIISLIPLPNVIWPKTLKNGVVLRKDGLFYRNHMIDLFGRVC